MFHSFLSDDSKQDAVTTTSHKKNLIEILREKKVLTSTLRTVWENTDGCAEQYICALALYLMSFFSKFRSIIIDQGISAPIHGKEVVDVLNAIYKQYAYIN